MTHTRAKILCMTKICGFPDCGHALYAKGYCRAHYAQLSKGHPLVPRSRVDREGPCSFDDCGRPIYAKRLCYSHYRAQRDGRPLVTLRARAQHRSGPCEFPHGCERPISARGLCSRHYELKAYAERLGIEWTEVVRRYPPDGRCQSCGRTQQEAAPGRKFHGLSLDHCHDSNRLRGFLCGPCNAGIGMLGDTAERLAQALAYLTENNTYWGETA